MSQTGQPVTDASVLVSLYPDDNNPKKTQNLLSEKRLVFDVNVSGLSNLGLIKGYIIDLGTFSYYQTEGRLSKMAEKFAYCRKRYLIAKLSQKFKLKLQLLAEMVIKS